MPKAEKPSDSSNEKALGRALGTTWPLFSEPVGRSFPEDPKFTVTPFRPDQGELEALEQRSDLPETNERAEKEAEQLRASQPPVAPEWMRASRALVAWLEERIRSGAVDSLEEATIARTWSAFSLAGIGEPQVMRVAHVVSRAHHAIRESRRGATDLQAAVVDCARVLHAGLPSKIRDRMPVERTVHVVRKFRTEADAWTAVVDGTSELLGWKDFARVHAASIIRIMIDRGRR